MHDLNRLIERCRGSVLVSCNEHRSNYQSVAEYLAENEVDGPTADEMIRRDRVVEIQFYPATPVSFYRVYHWDLEGAVRGAHKTLDAEGPRGKVIVLDPGHGLKTNGMYSRPLMLPNNGRVKVIPGMYPSDRDEYRDRYREDLGTLAIARGVSRALHSLGHIVRITRNNKNDAAHYLKSIGGDQNEKRKWKLVTDYTNRANADIFVSIHTNAGGGSGCSIFHADSKSRDGLAASLSKSMLSRAGIHTRRIAERKFMVLRNRCRLTGSSVLIEALFHDNYDEVSRLMTPDGVDVVARAIAEGIDKHARNI